MFKRICTTLTSHVHPNLFLHDTATTAISTILSLASTSCVSETHTHNGQLPPPGQSAISQQCHRRSQAPTHTDTACQHSDGQRIQTRQKHVPMPSQAERSQHEPITDTTTQQHKTQKHKNTKTQKHYTKNTQTHKRTNTTRLSAHAPCAKSRKSPCSVKPSHNHKQAASSRALRPKSQVTVLSQAFLEAWRSVGRCNL